MSRLEVPVRDRTLYATGDILLRVELDLDIKTSSGAWKPETVLVDSGTEITTFPAWLAKREGLPMPQNPTRHVLHGQTGLLVPPDDRGALVSAIRSLVDSPELRARLGAAARARIRAWAFPEPYAAKLGAIIDNVLDRTAAPRTAA